MEVGDIYLYKDFSFEDSSKKDKLFVVVNSPKEKENYFICLTTSKEKKPYRIKKQGCFPEKNYFMFYAKTDDWFKKDTWMLFEKIYEMSFTQLLDHKINKSKIEYKSKLTPKNIRAVLNCILQSEDVPIKQLSSIKRTLETLKHK